MINKVHEIIWWESCITEHQIHTLSELSKLSNVKLSVYVQRLNNPRRQIQGWTECDWSLIDIEVIPTTKYRFIYKVLKNKKYSTHIFGGPFDSFLISFALFLSTFMGLKTYILTEPYLSISSDLLSDKNKFTNWVVSKIRPMKYKILWTLLKNKIDGVFAISSSAIKQLKDIGIMPKKIFPFAYFIPPLNSLPENNSLIDSLSSNDILRIVFIGNVIHTKGIDIAINAVNEINSLSKKVTLDVFGPYSKKNKYAWSSTVRYQGLIPFGKAQHKIQNYDLLILPSRYDGWGVVINEAILAKVPVICSNQAGASSLVKKWGCGYCYESSNVIELKQHIENIHSNKDDILINLRLNIQKAADAISPLVGAKFILSSIQSDVKINKENPWYV
jgi:glycosyltransferase involved in cell wall biosynthesis